jgi:hypothetical protein
MTSLILIVGGLIFPLALAIFIGAVAIPARDRNEWHEAGPSHLGSLGNAEPPDDRGGRGRSTP